MLEEVVRRLPLTASILIFLLSMIDSYKYKLPAEHSFCPAPKNKKGIRQWESFQRPCFPIRIVISRLQTGIRIAIPLAQVANKLFRIVDSNGYFLLTVRLDFSGRFFY